MANWELRTPVVLIIYNRPGTTGRVFEAIRSAHPPMLFVIGDGPRAGRVGDVEMCKAARAVVEEVDWPCEVLKNYTETNLGCKRRVSSGLDWVFKTVEEAIILEDDCLPHPTFFRFCEELLEKYRYDERVMLISGVNFQFGLKRGDASYYFSRYVHIWGWASWRRAWQYYDVDMKLWTSARDRTAYLRVFEHRDERRFWANVWDGVCAGGIDTWDFQWVFACMARNGLSILPQVNLVSNIGFGVDGTHTNVEGGMPNLPTQELEFPVGHLEVVARDVDADEHTSRLEYRMPGLTKRIFRRAKRIIQRAAQLGASALQRRFFLNAGSYDNLPRNPKLLWRIIRGLIPANERWFFEGQIEIPGQLWHAERQLIYHTIRTRRPQTVFEIGTWQGGGSTLFITQALYENGAGRLHTVELNPDLYASAVENYRQYCPHLLPFVKFHAGSSTDVYPSLLQQEGEVDVLFLDGICAEQSLAEYQLFAPYLRRGAILIAHDWFDTKMSLLRPFLEADPSWQIEHVLEAPHSVGLAVMQKRSD